MLNIEQTIAQFPDGQITVIPKGLEFLERPKAGFYQVIDKDMGSHSEKQIHPDTNIRVPLNAKIISDSYIPKAQILKYFSNKSVGVHKALNISHKLGVLLHGVQGTGKTTACNDFAQELIDTKDAVVVSVNGVGDFAFAIEILKKMKTIQDFFSVIIFDECEDTMQSYEGAMKRFLDSGDSLGNNLFLFCTNYVHKIPDTIKDRPSRIKISKEITTFEDEVLIGQILESLIDGVPEDLRPDKEFLLAIAPSMKNKTLDELKNAFLDAILEFNLEEVVLDVNI